jgi:hypothetical protein
LKIFLSYAHHDERLRQELEKHLAALKRSELIDTWCDRRLSAGTDFATEIDEQLVSADIVLLLISPDFMMSDYCYRREMGLALARHDAGVNRVIPIILRPVDWKPTPLGRLLALPRDGKPITTWNRRDDALLDVARGVRLIVEELGSRSPRKGATLRP